MEFRSSITNWSLSGNKTKPKKKRKEITSVGRGGILLAGAILCVFLSNPLQRHLKVRATVGALK